MQMHFRPSRAILQKSPPSQIQHPIVSMIFMRTSKRIALKPQPDPKKEPQVTEAPKRHYKGVSEDVAMLVGDVSAQLALVFNRLIFTINNVRNNMQIEEEERKRRRKEGKETIDLVSMEQQEQLQKKEMKKLRKKFKPYELDYQQSKPKKPVSSFFIFYQEKIRQLGPQSGDSSGPKLSQIVADIWKGLSEEQKRPYIERANETKQKYIQEMRQYIEENAEWIQEAKQEKRNAINKQKGLKGNQSSEGAQEEPEIELDKRYLNRKLKGISLRQMKLEQRKEYSHRPKAPVSSFFIFYKEEAKNISEKYSVHEGKKLAKLASDIWKSMPEQEKRPYDAKAQEEREKYHQEMRQYRINFPEEVKRRKQKISASMRRYFRKANEDEDSNSSSDSGSHASSDFQESKSYESVGTSKDDATAQPKPEKKVQRRDNNLLPNKPRGPVCGFFQYYQKNIRKFMTPGAQQKDHGSDLVRRASQKWKHMTAAEKHPYGQMYKADRQRYLKEMEDYKKNHPEEYEIYLKVTNKSKTGPSGKENSGDSQAEGKDDKDNENIDSEGFEKSAMEDSLGEIQQRGINYQVKADNVELSIDRDCFTSQNMPSSS